MELFTNLYIGSIGMAVNNLKICIKNHYRKMLQAAVTAAFALTIKTIVYPSVVFAQILNPTGPNVLCDLERMMGFAIDRAVVPLAAVVLFVMLVIGGFLYLSSGGDPKGIEQAKKTLTSAIAGIALLVLAWFVLNFIEVFTGVRVTVFSIPCPPPPG